MTLLNASQAPVSGSGVAFSSVHTRAHAQRCGLQGWERWSDRTADAYCEVSCHKELWIPSTDNVELQDDSEVSVKSVGIMRL